MRRYVVAALALATTMALAATPTFVTIAGAYVHAESLSGAQFAQLPHLITTATEHDGTVSHYAGVPLIDLLRRDGLPTGELRGALARTYVAVEGSDGYIAIYSLTELDAKTAGCTPILADQRNGSPLTAATGPFHVVAPCDSAQARWVRNVVSLTVVTVPRPTH
jgi:hypothetical protein